MTSTPIASPSSSRRPALALLAVIGLAVIAAGCGGNAPSSASVSGAAAGTNGASDQAAAYRFSACMRSHGVNNFPDPKVRSTANGTSLAIAINPSISGQPAFKSASQACKNILPSPRKGSDEESPAQVRARVQAGLAFSRCLRAHGFPHFPDPDARGRFSVQLVSQAGIDLHTPALLTAAENCTSVTHGLLTRAQVAESIRTANASGSQTGSGG